MDFLPLAFNTLKLYKQFIVYVLIDTEPKKIKRPANYITGAVCDAHDPSAWTDADTAIAAAKRLGINYGVGFVITDKDPFFLLDIDSCYNQETGWSELSKTLLAKLAGAGVEVSASQKGLHVLGTTEPFEHGCRNDTLGLELYTSKRFVALTGIHATGDVSVDCTKALKEIVSTYFGPTAKTQIPKEWWSDTAVPEWSGPEDDDELLAMAMKSQSTKSKFGIANTATFAELWDNIEPALAQFYPPDANFNEPYNRSRVDAALAQHLAWWTGCNAERMLRLMKRSKLYRDKWDREDYLPRTIRAARGNTNGCLVAQKHTNQEKSSQTFSSFLSPLDQKEYFNGCVYVCEDNAIVTPGGMILDRERFNVMYGGKTFVLDRDNAKTTNKPWDAFTMNAAQQFPKVHGSTFKPDLEPGLIIKRDSELLVNTYWPYQCMKKKGDIGPFLQHVANQFTDDRDQEIIINYLAALVQYLGKKFQWCIVIQGAPGNGKTFFTRCISYVIGDRYVQMPRSDEIGSKFNDWQVGCMVVVVEDVFFPGSGFETLETLKPMITNERLMVEGKGKKKVMKDICCNYILNTNHKEGLRKSKDDRRFAVFYTAQQTAEDLIRCGMDIEYFQKLYNWAINHNGFAYIADYLCTYSIKREFDPLLQVRAPITSTTEAAIKHGLGNIENEIYEAIESERIGFKNGWVCTTPLNALFKEIGADKRIPHNKRRDLMRSLGYDWHPHLKEGRVTSIMPGENSKPRLYIRVDHKDRNITDPQKIMDAYKDAQK